MPGKKKITKKRLKEPDEFITFAQKALLFISHHYKKVVTGGIILLIIILFIIFFRMWERQKEEEAYRKLGLAMALYQRASSVNRERLPSEYKNVLAKFDEVITEFLEPRLGNSLFYIRETFISSWMNSKKL
jgi:hypothetical protein